MTDTTTHLAEALITLCGQAGPFVLRDQDDEPLHLSTLNRLDALLAVEPEPYVDPVASGEVRFVYQIVEAEFDGAWACETKTPSLVLTKPGAEARYYVLDQPQPREAVEALAAALGCDLDTAAPLPGSNGWAAAVPPADTDLTWRGGATFALAELMEHFTDTPVSAVVDRPAPPVSGLGRYKDATIRSVFDFEDPRLAEPITVSLGTGVKETNWKPMLMTRMGALDGFCTHRVARKKDSAAMVLGKLPEPDLTNDRESNRRNGLIDEVWMVGLDFDTGVTGDDLAQAMTDAGLLGVLASTFSHMTTTTTETYRSFALWMVETGRAATVEEAVVDRDVVRARMAAEPKKIVPAVVDTMEIEITGEGAEREVVITHAPLPKWRLILPLDRPFIPADHTTDDEEGFRVWRGVAPALARRLGGLPFDHACVDPARLWYLPNHPAERPDYRIDLFGGDLLSLDDILAEAAELAEAEADQPSTSRTRKPSTTASTGPFDERWIAREGAGFEIVKLLTEVVKPRQDPKLKLVRGSRGKGKVTIRCPFADGHGKRDTNDSAGAFASAPDASLGENFTIYCSHGSCQSQKRDRLTYLNKMLADGWFSEAEARAYETIDHGEPAEDVDDVDVEAALAEYSQAGGHTPLPAQVKPKPAATSGYPLPKAAGKFELTEVDGRKFFAFPPDEEGKGGGLAFSRWSVVGGGVHPDRGGLRDLEIAFENEVGAREIFRIPADKAANRGYAIGALRGQGVAFGSAQGETVAHRILMMTQPTNKVIRDRTGWLEDGVFMLPSGAVVGAPDGIDLRLADTVRAKAPPTAGTLEGWKAGAAEACRSESVSLKIGLLAGLAGPIVALTGQATLVINFAGQSSQGKTFRQQIGVSASGPVKPGVGQLQSANSTQNAMEIPLERGSGSITAFDELHLTSGKIAQNLIFIASGQQGRNRASNTGGQGLVRSWRGGVVTLSSEVGLAQKLHQEGERLAGGATVRAIELNAAEGRLDNEAYTKVSAMLTNYGHALPVVITTLRDAGYVDHPEALAKRVAKVVADLGVEPSDAMAYRSATGLAYLVVAGDIAVEKGLLPSTFEPVKVAAEVWAASMAGALKAASPIDRAIAALVENLNSRRGTEVYDTTDDEQRQPYREVLAVIDDQHLKRRVYVVRSKVLAEWSGGSADVDELKKALVDRGMAIPHKRAGCAPRPTWDYWPMPVGRGSSIVLDAKFIDGAID